MKNVIKSISNKIGCNYEDEPFTEDEVLQAVDEALDFTMTGMDIANELQKKLDKSENSLTDGMSDNEKKAYGLGVSNSIELLKQLLESDSFIFDLGTEVPEEQDIGTIIKVMRDMDD